MKTRSAGCSISCCATVNSWPPSSTPCCTTAAARRCPSAQQGCRQCGSPAVQHRHRRLHLSTPACRRWPSACSCLPPRRGSALLKDEARAAPGAPDHPGRQAGAAHRSRGRTRLHRRAALRRLAGTPAASRELPRAAGRAPRGAGAPAAAAGPGALAHALPDAAPWRDRRACRCAPAARALRALAVARRSSASATRPGTVAARPMKSR